MAAMMCGSGKVIIDVGCDHGYLPAFLLGEGKFRKAILTDVNEKPLEAARTTFGEAGLDGTFLLTDGLGGVEADGEYVISVCGMGGELIASILTSGIDTAKRAERLVLQPMSRPEALRRFLFENGFEIEREVALSEADKLYLLFSARYTGAATDFNEYDAKLGKIGTLEGESAAYYMRMREAFEVIAHGKDKAGLSHPEEDMLLCEIRRRAALVNTDNGEKI